MVYTHPMYINKDPRECRQDVAVSCLFDFSQIVNAIVMSPNLVHV